MDPYIVVFTADADAVAGYLSDSYNFEVCMRALPLEEQLAVRNVKHAQTKALVLKTFTLAVLNHCVAATLYRPWAPLQYTYNEFGKPGLRAQAFEFNSSSSNSMVSIAVQFHAATPIGIDLSHERQDAISETNFMEQFRGIFADSEARQLNAVDNIASRYMLFNQLWTLKEAFTKFLGCGLNIDLLSFAFDVSRETLLLKNPQFHDSEGFLRPMNVLWQRGTTFDTANVTYEQIDGPISCMSAVLKKGKDLPVICSLVHQLDPDVPVKTVYVDMEKLFTEYPVS